MLLLYGPGSPPPAEITGKETSWITGGILLVAMGGILYLVTKKGSAYPLIVDAPPPFRFGQTIIAKLMTPSLLNLKGDFRVVLQCREKNQFPFSRETRAPKLIFVEEFFISSIDFPPGTYLPIEIRLPHAGYPTVKDQRGFWRKWNLFVTAPTHGVQYSARFELPIF